jgi:NADH-quinone oxidoreductase subunit J
VAFYLLIFLTVVTAAAILFVRSVLNAALCLIACLLSIAGLFILLNAAFLAIVQIMIYAGGILLLIIFGIMITRHQADSSGKRQGPAFLLALAMITMLWYALQDITVPASDIQEVTGSQIGKSLMTHYAAPFEIAGILLLVSMIGAMLVSSFRSRV